MLCDRNNSIVFRVAREYVKKETSHNEFSQQYNAMEHTKQFINSNTKRA